MIRIYNLFDKINKIDRGGNLWDDIVRERDGGEDEIREFLSNVAQQISAKQYRLSNSDSWDLYAISRIFDLIITKLQSVNIGKTNSQYISNETVLDFGNRIGVKEKEIKSYHPFYCEIFSVRENNNIDEILIDKIHWPAFHLNGMLVCRAGVSISSPRNLVDPLVAATSTLFWSYIRENRTASDQSHGWGHNSQWRTDFRIDLDCEDKYIYNYKSHGKRNINLNDDGLDGSEIIDGMGIVDRRSLIRNRCKIKDIPIEIPEVDIYPYDDTYVEIKI